MVAALLAPEALTASTRPPDPSTISVGELCRLLQHGKVQVRRRAASELGRRGDAGADCLVYAVRMDADLEVRREAATALGSIGAAAGREACVQLQWIARSRNPWDDAMQVRGATEAQKMSWVQYEDLQRSARRATERIGCR